MSITPVSKSNVARTLAAADNHDTSSDFRQSLGKNHSVLPIVSLMLDISESTLYELWKELEERQGECLPQSFLHAPRVKNASIIVNLFSGVFRSFIISQKLLGLVAEVPDIQKNFERCK